jgi:DNA-binding winged helix-turn-helix (wHTH) protein
VDTELRPKSFKLLQYFAENPERLISKEEIVKAVWRHAAVTATRSPVA